MKCQYCGNPVNIRTDGQCPHCSKPVLSTDDTLVRIRQQVLIIWPDWVVTDFLGKGSYGSVYKAVHADNTESGAAIKILRIPANDSEADSLRSENMNEEQTNAYFREIADSFADEIRTMQYFKGLQNIISIEDHRIIANEDGPGWSIFIRMELLTPFAEYKKNKKMAEEDILKLGIDICTALSYCEQRNVIHRDVKPENIFLNHYGDFKLGDFGIAKNLQDATSAYTQKGTITYMAPEVASGLKYDNRADIYSLGIVLYRLLNDDLLPFATSKSFTQKQQSNERRMRGENLPPPANASPALARIILKACAYHPQDRFTCAKEMKTALLQAELDDQDKTLLQEDYTLINPDATVTELHADLTVVNKEDEMTIVKKPAADTAIAAGKTKEKRKEQKKENNTTKTIRTAVLIAIVFILGICIGISVLHKTTNVSTDTKPTPDNVKQQTTSAVQETQQTEALTKEPAFSSASIPDNAVPFNGHSYYIYAADSFSTWEDAKNFCETKGGYLATIASDVENDFLHTLLRNSSFTEAYFGHHRTNALENWNWANGEQTDYKKWHPDERTNPNTLLYTRLVAGSSSEWRTGDFALRSASGTATILSCQASSELEEEIVTHVADRIADGKTESGWVEGVTGYGIGESITVTFDKTYLIDTFTIYAGYHRSEDFFNENAAPSALTLTFSDGSSQSVSLQKIMQAQTFRLNPVNTSSVKIRIDGAHAGTKYTDTVISEIAFSGAEHKRGIICEWDT